MDDYTGSIYTSTDSGVTWTEQTVTGTHGWTFTTSSQDGTKLVAVDGYSGYIYTSADSGATWTERTSAGSRYWTSVASSTDGTKLAAVVGGGYIYTSTDSGVTWAEHTSAGLYDLYSITSSADGIKLAAVAFNGYIYTSTDSGATWTERTSAGSHWWRSITSSSDGTKLAAVGYSGDYIYSSTDSGVTWTEQTAAGERDWTYIVSSADGGKLAAIVNGGNIYLGTTEGPATDTIAMQSLTPTANQAAHPAVSHATLSVTSSACYSIDKPTVKTLGIDGMSAPEPHVTLLGGIAFNVTCATTGGSTNATVSLGQTYADTSQLRVYKRDAATGVFEDITSHVRLTNTANATTVAYTLTDGGDYDEDGLANGTISDPIYFGVVAGATTTVNSTLANTGMSVIVMTLAGVVTMVVGSIVTLKSHRQKRVSFTNR